MNTVMIALLKREVLEHKNIWRVPLILIGLAVLVKLSLTIGNLSFDIDVPDIMQLDETVSDVKNSVVAQALNGMNFIIMITMFAVAIFYALSCLYNERQDESVLFWRSLPISDTTTIASKLIIGLVVIPLIVVVCQALVALLFMGAQSLNYLQNFYGSSLLVLCKILLWSLLPVVAWCMLCSSIASKNPFLLAFVAPLVLILIDKLFLSGTISELFVINRLTGISSHTMMPLVTGLIFSAVCIGVSIVKRSQRI